MVTKSRADCRTRHLRETDDEITARLVTLARLGQATRGAIIFIGISSVLVACKTTEEMTMERMSKWGEACQHETGYAYQACVANLEQAYQADRAGNAARGAALLGYAASYNAALGAQYARPNAMRCTTTQSGGMHPSWFTNCY